MSGLTVHDPTIFSFDSIPACDGHAAYAYVTL